MSDTRPEPESTRVTLPASPEEPDWGDDGYLPEAGGAANWIDGAPIVESSARHPFLVVVVFLLALLVAVLSWAVVESPIRSTPATGSTPLGATSVASLAPTQVSGVPAADAGKTPIEDLLISGGCKISSSCPASVTFTTFAPVTHGIKISAGTPVILRLDGHYSVLRAAIYIDGKSTASGIFAVKDISDPEMPLNEGAMQFSQPMQQGTLQVPISSHARQIALTVDSGTVDLVGYMEGPGQGY